MILTFGSHSRPTNEVTIGIGKESQIDDRGRRIGVKVTWTVTGIVQADTHAALIAAVAALEAGFAGDRKDLTFKYDDGTILHQLRNKWCSGGVRVIRPPYYPKGNGAEASTYRTYEVVLEGQVLPGRGSPDIAEPSSGAQLTSWQETLTMSGGGPLFVMLPVAVGRPIKQIVRQATPYMAVQSGSATGRFAYPPYPGPIFPRDEHQDQRQETPGSPKRQGDDLIDWPVSWRYSFESASPLRGLPTSNPPF